MPPRYRGLEALVSGTNVPQMLVSPQEKLLLSNWDEDTAGLTRERAQLREALAAAEKRNGYLERKVGDLARQLWLFPAASTLRRAEKAARAEIAEKWARLAENFAKAHAHLQSAIHEDGAAAAAPPSHAASYEPPRAPTHKAELHERQQRQEDTAVRKGTAASPRLPPSSPKRSGPSPVAPIAEALGLSPAACLEDVRRALEDAKYQRLDAMLKTLIDGPAAGVSRHPPPPPPPPLFEVSPRADGDPRVLLPQHATQRFLHDHSRPPPPAVHRQLATGKPAPGLPEHLEVLREAEDRVLRGHQIVDGQPERYHRRRTVERPEFAEIFPGAGGGAAWRDDPAAESLRLQQLLEETQADYEGSRVSFERDQYRAELARCERLLAETAAHRNHLIEQQNAAAAAAAAAAQYRLQQQHQPQQHEGSQPELGPQIVAKAADGGSRASSSTEAMGASKNSRADPTRKSLSSGSDASAAGAPDEPVRSVLSSVEKPSGAATAEPGPGRHGSGARHLQPNDGVAPSDVQTTEFQMSESPARSRELLTEFVPVDQPHGGRGEGHVDLYRQYDLPQPEGPELQHRSIHPARPPPGRNWEEQYRHEQYPYRQPPSGGDGGAAAAAPLDQPRAQPPLPQRHASQQEAHHYPSLATYQAPGQPQASLPQSRGSQAGSRRHPSSQDSFPDRPFSQSSQPQTHQEPSHRQTPRDRFSQPVSDPCPVVLVSQPSQQQLDQWSAHGPLSQPQQQQQQRQAPQEHVSQPVSDPAAGLTNPPSQQQQPQQLASDAGSAQPHRQLHSQQGMSQPASNPASLTNPHSRQGMSQPASEPAALHSQQGRISQPASDPAAFPSNPHSRQGMSQPASEPAALHSQQGRISQPASDPAAFPSNPHSQQGQMSQPASDPAAYLTNPHSRQGMSQPVSEQAALHSQQGRMSQPASEPAAFLANPHSQQGMSQPASEPAAFLSNPHSQQRPQQVLSDPWSAHGPPSQPHHHQQQPQPHAPQEHFSQPASDPAAFLTNPHSQQQPQQVLSGPWSAHGPPSQPHHHHHHHQHPQYHAPQEHFSRPASDPQQPPSDAGSAHGPPSQPHHYHHHHQQQPQYHVPQEHFSRPASDPAAFLQPQQPPSDAGSAHGPPSQPHHHHQQQPQYHVPQEHFSRPASDSASFLQPQQPPSDAGSAHGPPSQPQSQGDDLRAILKNNVAKLESLSHRR
ncbi:hypothetical protein DIPPA_03308 [Diplonema papillatum]|nr:hypothetical protein DIPPA_03308 [Diplonema papillatum]